MAARKATRSASGGAPAVLSPWSRRRVVGPGRADQTRMRDSCALRPMLNAHSGMVNAESGARRGWASWTLIGSEAILRVSFDERTPQDGSLEAPDALRELLRLKYDASLPQRAIAQACGVGPGTVTAYLQRAAAAGLSGPSPRRSGRRRVGGASRVEEQPAGAPARQDVLQRHDHVGQRHRQQSQHGQRAAHARQDQRILRPSEGHRRRTAEPQFTPRARGFRSPGPARRLRRTN
jgi:hypothetical protein